MNDIRNFKKSEALKDGTAITIRAVRPEDKQMMYDAFHDLERASRYTRYFGFKDHLSDADLRRASEVDFEREVALVVTTIVKGKEIIIGGSRYILLTEESATAPAAEIAFTIEEDYQGQGLASRMFNHLADIARSKGVQTFEADVLPQNKAMIAVFAGRGLPIDKKFMDGAIHVTLSLNENQTGDA